MKKPAALSPVNISFLSGVDGTTRIIAPLSFAMSQQVGRFTCHQVFVSIIYNTELRRVFRSDDVIVEAHWFDWWSETATRSIDKVAERKPHQRDYEIHPWQDFAGISQECQRQRNSSDSLPHLLPGHEPVTGQFAHRNTEKVQGRYFDRKHRFHRYSFLLSAKLWNFHLHLRHPPWVASLDIPLNGFQFASAQIKIFVSLFASPIICVRLKLLQSSLKGLNPEKV